MTEPAPVQAAAPAAADAAAPLSLPGSAGLLRVVLREMSAGIAAAVGALPTYLSSGLLAFAPFGPGISAHGAAAGLLGGAVGGFLAALTARSSFIVSGPRTSSALVLAGLAAALLPHQPFAGDIGLGFVAMAICLLLAGLWQIGFGILGIGRLIKFTPHPVLAGFINGVSLLIALGAIRILLRGGAAEGGVVHAVAFSAAVTALIVFCERIKTRLPPAIIGLAVGTAAFYALRFLMPSVSLGPTVGSVAIDLGDTVRMAIAGSHAYGALSAEAPQILLVSVVIALVVSLESLLVARMARNLAPVPAEPARFLVAQGIGNVAAAAVGGIAISAGPSQTATNFRAGGRTRISGLSCAALLFGVGVLVPQLLAVIPQVVLCATLFASSITIFDRWSLRLVRDTVVRRDNAQRSNLWKNLAVIAAVMAVTATTSVTSGVLTGIVLSGLIFIVNMSRPLVRLRQRGDAVFSRRVRPDRDAEILRRSGPRRVVLDLQGVMFFGNTDDLCTEIEALFKDADMVLLDLRRVVDIDVSAIGALEQAMSKALAKKKLLLFCAVPAPHVRLFEAEAGPGREASVFADRDTALEWMEEKVLREAGRSEFEEVPLEQVEFMRGLDPHEIEAVRAYLLPMSFPAGTVLCREGEEADYLWILSSGSVSVLVGSADGQGGKRLASLARGTIVGEMTFLDRGRRTATVRADEDVTGYMFDRDTFDSLLHEHPNIGSKILANVGHEMVRRLRATYQSFAAEA